ncbi:MAG: ribonuclease HIII [Opitutales bacterium]|nr:ribonuclease HIII [Opitutales bacterium]
MARKKKAPEESAPKEKKLSMYTIALDKAQMEKVRAYAQDHSWDPFSPDYSLFGFKSKVASVTVVGYTSGKLVISGKGTEELVQNFIEPEVTGVAKLGYDEVHNPEWFQPHAGLDEAGKGDVFGPVVAATVIADEAAIRSFLKAGVKDSKSLVDSNIMRLEALIRKTPGVVVKTAFCTMARYNELMSKPQANLNKLLAWLHARALEGALAEKDVEWGLLDQFSKTPLVQQQMKKDGYSFNLQMRTKGESDPVVAAASICARAEFVRQMQQLSELAGEELKKGAAGHVKAQAKRLSEKFGAEFLTKVSKMHFRTIKEVLGLPVEEKKPWGAFRRKDS